MGKNIMGDGNLSKSENWIHKHVIKAPYESYFRWSEDQSQYYTTWYTTYRAYWWFYRYEDGNIEIFGLSGHPNVTSLGGSGSTGDRRLRHHAWYDEDAGVSQILNSYSGVDNDRKSFHGHGPQFEIGVSKIFDQMSTHYVSPNGSLDGDNWVMFDRERMTFVKNRAEFDQITSDEGQTHVGGFFNDQGRILGLNLQSLSVDHNYYYRKVENSPPVISFSEDFTGQLGTVSIKVEETDLEYNSGVRDVRIQVKGPHGDSDNTVSGPLDRALPYTTTESISGEGDHEIIVTATDRAGNESSVPWKRTIPEAPLACNNWNEGVGVPESFLEGKDDTADLVQSFETPNLNDFGAGGQSIELIRLKTGKLFKDYSEQEVIKVLQGAFYEFEEKLEAMSQQPKYFILWSYGLPNGTENVQFIATENLNLAKQTVDIQAAIHANPVPGITDNGKIVTYGFCQTGATEGAGQDAFLSTAPDYLSSSCDKFPGNAGVSSKFLQGVEYQLIENVTHINSSETQLQASFNVKDGASADDTYKLIQDFLHKAKSTDSFSAVDWNYKYFTLVHIEPVGTAFEVRGATSISKLWKESSTFQFSYSESVNYTVFGYCDTRSNIGAGNTGVTFVPPSPAVTQNASLESIGLPPKASNKIKDLIDGYTLGTAIAVTPELVINQSWNWLVDQSIENAMCVNRENFYNYLGHYISPADALTFAPFGNDLTRAVDGIDSSTPMPFDFGGAEPRETGNTVFKIVAGSQIDNDKKRIGEAKEIKHSKGISPSSSTAFDNADSTSSASAFVERDNVGIYQPVYDEERILREYKVDKLSQLIACNVGNRDYNQDLQENFAAFTEYVWGHDNDANTNPIYTTTGMTEPSVESDDWGDPDKKFQSSVTFKITITANNDRGKSDAGVSITSVNERARNDTQSWIKVWIGDVGDQDKRPGKEIITYSNEHPDGGNIGTRYTDLYEFYNPHFSTGKIGFGNGESTSKVFFVKINRKPHEEALRIYAKGYVGGNRRGELSPKSFLPAHGKVFQFADTVKGFLRKYVGVLYSSALNWSLPAPVEGFGLNMAVVADGIPEQLENGMNSVFNTVYDLVETGIHLITNGIFGFLFAIMGESYVETYHSRLDVEVEEQDIQESIFADFDVESHPATKYFGSTHDRLAYIYTQFHYPFVDANRFRVFGKKFHYKQPFMQNEIKTASPRKGSKVFRENRYFVANLFRLTYETNIGVFYELMLKQLSEDPASKEDHNYNIKLVGHEEPVKSDKRILEQAECVYDVMFPTNLDQIPTLLEDGLGTHTTTTNTLNGVPKDDSKMQKKTSNTIEVNDYMNVLSEYGISANDIGLINSMIGDFTTLKEIFEAEDGSGYDLNTWKKRNESPEYNGLGNGTPKNLSYKIAEFILWYVNPNGIAQQTRLAASTLHEYEKITEKNIIDHDSDIPSDPEDQPLIVNGEIYDKKCD